MGNSECYEIEKRKHMRTTYPTGKRPTFQARGQKLQIKDLSRGGLKFCNHEKVIINGWVKGSMDLIDGTSIEMEGIVVRNENRDIGLAFISDLEDDVYHKVTNTRRSNFN